MIRINFLKPRLAQSEGGEPVRSGSAFISAREMLLGGFLLGAAGILLYVQFRPAADGRGQEPGPGTEQAAAAPERIEMEEPEQPSEDQRRWLEQQIEEERPGPQEDRSAAPRTPDEKANTRAGGGAPDGEAAASTGELRGIEFTPAEGSVSILAATTHRPEPVVFRLGNPKRVVIDLPGTVVAIPESRRQRTVLHSGVSRIRVGQFSADPPRARIVLDVAEFPEVALQPGPQGLEMVVRRK